MTRRSLAVPVVLAGLLVLVTVRPAQATKIDPMLFEELVVSADMVALVECETAGGMVARFKVVESFKGPKAGTIVAVSWPANYYGEQFPVALCGTRYILTAFKLPPNNLYSYSVGGPVPLWWRKLPADYQLPLMQGMWGPGRRDRARALANMSPAEQETALLRALIDDHLLRRYSTDVDEHTAALRKRFDALKSTEELVRELARLGKEDPKAWGHRTFRVLYKGGMAKTLEVLDKLAADQKPWAAEQVKWIRESVQGRLSPKKEAGPNGEDDGPDAVDKTPPTDAQLKVWRATLADMRSDEWGKAFTHLLHHDPGSVAAFLVKWQEDDKEDGRRGRDMAHGLSSYFCWKCGKDREKHLSALLEAKDAWVRVAGAVYLCFENQDRGVAALKKLTALEGDPGAWAALTLARRGHKEAVPRALQLFPREWSDEERTRSFGTLHQNLQNHLLVLLSNSAHAGKAPQYTPADGRPTLGSLQAWWQQQQANVVLRDPWLATLEKQKID